MSFCAGMQRACLSHIQVHLHHATSCFAPLTCLLQSPGTDWVMAAATRSSQIRVARCSRRALHVLHQICWFHELFAWFKIDACVTRPCRQLLPVTKSLLHLPARRVLITYMPACSCCTCYLLCCSRPIQSPIITIFSVEHDQSSPL